MEDKNKRGMYYITSMYLTAYLLTKGFEVVKVQKIEQRGKEKIAFFFKNTDDIHDAIKKYKHHDELQRFINNYLNVKNIIHLQMDYKNKKE